jgi:hypothetical protein
VKLAIRSDPLDSVEKLAIRSDPLDGEACN